MIINTLDLRFFYFGLIIVSTLILALILGVSKCIIILSILFLILYTYNRSKRFKNSILKYLLSLLILIGVSFSTNYLFENVLEQRHRDRINLIIGKEVDDRGIGYNTNQSKIAISNGGLFGAGFLQGTQTKGNFVPRQHTDYIFSTIGEEWGFIGTLLTILFFMLLITRISLRAEKQVNHFKRIYCHCFAIVLNI